MAGKMEGAADTFGAELFAMARAMDLAVDISAIRVAFETDSQLLALALNKQGRDTSQWAAVLNDLKFQLRTWFSRTDVFSCRREANSVAHELAKIGKLCNVNEASVWEDDVPAHVAMVVLGEMPLV